MPTYEQVCYCGGPIKIVSIDEKQEKLKDGYGLRKRLHDSK